ncbi:hypothetical protein FALCPG4_000394 [Fusarium falciforme]
MDMGAAELGSEFISTGQLGARHKMQFAPSLRIRSKPWTRHQLHFAPGIAAPSGGEIRDQRPRLGIIQPSPISIIVLKLDKAPANRVENSRGRKYGTGSGQVNQRRGPLRSGP